MERIHRTFGSHPDPASDAGDQAFALVRAASECALVSTACADACLSEEDPAPLRVCIRLNMDCADICSVTARVISRPGRQDPRVLERQLEACIAACEASGEECRRHAPRMEHCRHSAEAADACVEACLRMRDALVA